MTPTAPITQDVLTLPRKLPEGKVNLVGLTREGLRAALMFYSGQLSNSCCQRTFYLSYPLTCFPCWHQFVPDSFCYCF